MISLNPQPVPEKYFGILIPGQLPILEFELIKDMLVTTLVNPGENLSRSNNRIISINRYIGAVSELTFFLNKALPDGSAGEQYSPISVTQPTIGCLYYSPPPFDNLQFIGAVGNTRPR